MESSDEDSEAEENPLANSQTQKRLEEMIAKREAKALPVPNPVRFDNPVGPVSPTTRRRTIIMREMSESLRKSESDPPVRADSRPRPRERKVGRGHSILHPIPVQTTLHPSHAFVCPKPASNTRRTTTTEDKLWHTRRRFPETPHPRRTSCSSGRSYTVLR
jgi:hypothetical protein